ncbi:MAG TPA: hypothetical protein PLQ97_02740 [Myxococcota bacterium]|nr:hypothetical protein [Myxococcota bacterium]HQK50747.1 hypothetical protein [Myxococcota bacterium]
MPGASLELQVFQSLPGDPHRDLAFEEDLVRRAPPAALFLYSWPRPAVVLGCGQRESDVDLAFCRREGIPVVRRASGGTGVVHHDDLAVSLVLAADHPWARRIGDLYDRFLEVLQEALAQVGALTERYVGPASPGRPRSPICFEGMGRETLLVGGRKAVGCAQARRRLAVLVHGFLLMHLDPVFHGAVFGVSPERIEASLAPLPPLDRRALLGALVVGFRDALEKVARGSRP